MMLAAGCSFAHGQGTEVDHYDQNNFQYSFPNLIAKKLDITCDNFSIPSASNELIFHNLIENLHKKNYTHCLVAWTTLAREAWSNKNEVWCANIHHATYLNLNKKIDLFVNNKVVSDDYHKKLKHYIFLLDQCCNIKNIKLVQVSSLPNGADVYLINQTYANLIDNNWTHPNKIAHQKWADDIFEKFYAT